MKGKKTTRVRPRNRAPRNGRSALRRGSVEAVFSCFGTWQGDRDELLALQAEVQRLRELDLTLPQ